LEVVPELLLLTCARFSREDLIHNPAAPALVMEGRSLSII